MISKERLEELIQQETIIYCSFYTKYAPYVRIGKWKLNNKMYVDDGVLYLEDCDDGEILYLTDIFENEEDANWHKEFGCIERTERSELPTWEELKNKREFYIGFNNMEGIIRYYLAINMPYKKDVGAILISYSDANNDTIICFDKIATKENYTLACRKAKELFLGDSDGDIR